MYNKKERSKNSAAKSENSLGLNVDFVRLLISCIINERTRGYRRDGCLNLTQTGTGWWLDIDATEAWYFAKTGTGWWLDINMAEAWNFS